jgi:hypothetical protein
MTNFARRAATLAALFLCSCTGGGPIGDYPLHLDVRNRIEAYLGTHPELPEHERQAIRERRVWIGMSREKAVASWGGAESIKYQDGKEIWAYVEGNRVRQYLIFEGDTLVRVWSPDSRLELEDE